MCQFLGYPGARSVRQVVGAWSMTPDQATACALGQLVTRALMEGCASCVRGHANNGELYNKSDDEDDDDDDDSDDDDDDEDGC